MGLGEGDRTGANETGHDAASAPGAFVLEVGATTADVDALGHVSNVVYVRWVQDVARAHSESVGWDLAAYRRAGGVFVVRRHEIDYLAPVRAGDRVLVTTWLGRWRGATAERWTRIVRAGDGAEAARARTDWVFVGIETGKPRRMPAAIGGAFGIAGGR